MYVRVIALRESHDMGQKFNLETGAKPKMEN